MQFVSSKKYATEDAELLDALQVVKELKTDDTLVNIKEQLKMLKIVMGFKKGTGCKSGILEEVKAVAKKLFNQGND